MKEQPIDSCRSFADSVAALIPGLRAADQEAQNQLWVKFYDSVVRLVASKMNGTRCTIYTPEDVAIDVFMDFFRKMSEPKSVEKFPTLPDRQSVWKLLVRFTIWETFDYLEKIRRRSIKEVGESALGELGIHRVEGSEPLPGYNLELAELLDQLNDPVEPKHGEKLRTVARMRMDGYADQEIAEQLKCSVRTVRNKVKTIQDIWHARALSERIR
jgi:DNA-directed RNA polymerase specialized sigma24 family protein